jgi:hypothetical protein
MGLREQTASGSPAEDKVQGTSIREKDAGYRVETCTTILQLASPQHKLNSSQVSVLCLAWDGVFRVPGKENRILYRNLPQQY